MLYLRISDAKIAFILFIVYKIKLQLTIKYTINN